MPPSRRFVSLYAVAYAGLFVAFLPFVSILLPMKVAAIDPANRVALLGRAAWIGALAASVANIGWGWLSDRTYRTSGTRRPWIAAGLFLFVLAFGAIHLSTTPATLLMAIVFWQMALNLMFAPLTAVMADEVPDRSKGMVAGLLGIAQPIGTLAGVVVTLPFLVGEGARYAANCALAVVLIVPFLILARERGGGASATQAAGTSTMPRGRDLALAWGARLAVQVAGNGVVLYAFFHFEELLAFAGLASDAAAQRIAWTMAAVTMLAVVTTLAAGRASDRTRRRKPFLAVAALAIAGGLGMMALADGFAQAASGYAAVICGVSGFLALHSALAMQMLPSPRHRGRDLGVLNLANTLPALVPPVLAAGLSDVSLAPVFIALGLIALSGGGMALAIRSER